MGPGGGKSTRALKSGAQMGMGSQDGQEAHVSTYAALGRLDYGRGTPKEEFTV